MSSDPSPHLTSDRVASFLDGRLTGVDRDVAIRHLAECDACREEVAELRATINSVPTVSRRGWIGAAAGLAATLAFLLLPRLPGNLATDAGNAGATRSESARRSGGSEAIDIVAPGDRYTLSAMDPVLTWRSAGASATYFLTVQDSAGGVVWSKSLSDTSQVLPDSARIEPGGSYFWSVDARLANGRTVTSGAHSFTVR